MNLRRALAGLLAILPLAALLALMTQLPQPERVPSHWSGRYPDEWTSGPAFLSTVLTITVLCAIGAAAMAVLIRVVPQAWSRWALATLATVGWGAVAAYVLTVWRTGVDGPERVREWWALVGVTAGLLAGVLTYLVHGRRRPAPAELMARIPERARVQAVGGRAARPVQPWSTDIGSGLLRWMGWGLIAVGVVAAAAMVLAGESLPIVGLLLVVIGGAGLLALAWASVRLHIDEDGLTVSSTVLGVRVTRVPAQEVAGVEVLDLDPMRWGGIGLRALPDRTALIIDGGPGIVVWKRDGRRLALQVTEGEAAARAGARTLLQAAGQRLAGSS